MDLVVSKLLVRLDLIPGVLAVAQALDGDDVRWRLPFASAPHLALAAAAEEALEDPAVVELGDGVRRVAVVARGTARGRGRARRVAVGRWVSARPTRESGSQWSQGLSKFVRDSSWSVIGAHDRNLVGKLIMDCTPRVDAAQGPGGGCGMEASRRARGRGGEQARERKKEQLILQAASRIRDRSPARVRVGRTVACLPSAALRCADDGAVRAPEPTTQVFTRRHGHQS